MDVSATPTAYPPAAQHGKLSSNALQTATTAGSMDAAAASNFPQVSAAMDHPAGESWN